MIRKKGVSFGFKSNLKNQGCPETITCQFPSDKGFPIRKGRNLNENKQSNPFVIKLHVLILYNQFGSMNFL